MDSWAAFLTVQRFMTVSGLKNDRKRSQTFRNSEWFDFLRFFQNFPQINDLIPYKEIDFIHIFSFLKSINLKDFNSLK
jgi:hypothetical protein